MGGFSEFSNLHDGSSRGPSEVNRNPTEEILTSRMCDPSSGKIDESLTNNHILHELATTKGLRIATLNINSLLKHIDQLRMIMQLCLLIFSLSMKQKMTSRCLIMK